MRRTDKEITEPGEIRAILEECRLGQIAFVTDGFPYLISMNYGLGPGYPPRLYFHGAGAGRKIELLRRDPRVAFQAAVEDELVTGNEACSWTTRYRSVIIEGRMEILTSAAEKRVGLDVIMAHHGFEGARDYPEAMIERTAVFRLTPERISAKSNR